MATLSQQIERIKSDTISIAAKKRAILALGVSDYEAKLLIDEIKTTSGDSMSYTFGVEIECFVPHFSVVAKAEELNVPIKYESYNHRDNTTYFKLVTDASLHGANGIECVSPILKGKNGLAKLKKACNVLKECGAIVNRSAGLHVHIGAAALSEQQYINVFRNYLRLEAAIDSFMANSRRGDNNAYCHSFFARITPSQMTSREAIKSALGYSRYYKVNPISIERHNTIEFRQHQGTTDFQKISMWVKFCAKLVEYSRHNEINGYVDEIEEIPFLSASEKAYFIGRREELN